MTSSDFSNPLDAEDPPSPLANAETLVNGRTFLVCSETGEVDHPGSGAVFEDLRFLSAFSFSLSSDKGSGHTEVEHLRTTRPNPFSLVAVSSVVDPHEPSPSAHTVLIHRVKVGRGTNHVVELRNLDDIYMTISLTVHLGADFAHLFDVKTGCPAGPSPVMANQNGHLILGNPSQGSIVKAMPEPAKVSINDLTWNLSLGPREKSHVEIVVEPIFDDHPAGVLFKLGQHDKPVLRAAADPPAKLTADNSAAVSAFDKALEDLASLRIYDPTDPNAMVIAAGAPWFMTLFGRDSLLTSWMSLPFAPELSKGVLSALANLQGQTTNPVNEEAPGKIIHELRRSNGAAAFGNRGRYYGTVDATPLFVMLAHETWRWGHLEPDDLNKLWPAIAAAAKWVDRSITQDQYGLLSYKRSTEEGLTNQGWKDSWDGVPGADGLPARGPIALIEAQGYAYAALRATTELAKHVDSAADVHCDGLTDTADGLFDRVNSMFWSDDLESFVLGIDGEGQQIGSVTTNPGHAVWSGVTDSDLADRYLSRCMESDMFTGWGLRTLSRDAAAYNPLSYHNGSVWPHDTSIVAAAAENVGRHDVVTALAEAAFATAAEFDSRPPELFAGFDKSDIPSPVPYPASCSPQAWASASILLHVRSLLGLDVEADQPISKSSWNGFRQISGVQIGPKRFDVRSDEASVSD
jgi:glycogen debranching enzyme